MANSFPASVTAGLILSEQLKPRLRKTSLVPPPPGYPLTFDSSKKDNKEKSAAVLPTCPMVYAIVTSRNLLIQPTTFQYGPPIVQPGTGGAVDPTPTPTTHALLPLDMNGVSLNVECHISTAFATVEGVWTLGLLKKDSQCDCLLAVPVHRQLSGDFRASIMPPFNREFTLSLNACSLLDLTFSDALERSCADQFPRHRVTLP